MDNLRDNHKINYIILYYIIDSDGNNGVKIHGITNCIIFPVTNKQINYFVHCYNTIAIMSNKTVRYCN